MKIEKIAVPIAIVLAGGLMAGALYLSNSKSNAAVAPAAATQTATTQAANVKIRPVSPNEHILGSPNAQVTIVEYSDTECPFCKEFQSTLHQVINDYGPSGEVAWVYRYFPIASLHPRSEKEAEAVECSSQLGGETVFWNIWMKFTPPRQATTDLTRVNYPKSPPTSGSTSAISTPV